MELNGTLFIAGRAVHGTGAAFHGVNPATGQAVGAEYREAGPEQIDDAATAAERAFREFSATTAHARRIPANHRR